MENHEADLFGAYERAERVRDEYQAELMGKSNVVGVGVGLRERGGDYTSEVVVVVFVSRKLPAAQLNPDDLIPPEIDGVPIDVQEIGEIGAQ
jgi:hypothetical protein